LYYFSSLLDGVSYSLSLMRPLRSVHAGKAFLHTFDASKV
jgi:hypothetical protein